MRKFFAMIVGLAMLMVGLTACGSNNFYRPAAFGEYGHCYYVDNPIEVQYLMNDGYCPHNWTPMLAPVYWRARYYNYYSSPAYINNYIPKKYQQSYISSNKAWGKTYAYTIKSESAKAKYVDSKGKTVPPSKVNPGKFGGGSRSGKGSGSRARFCAMSLNVNGQHISLVAYVQRGGGGGGFGGGGRSGGGSSRGGSGYSSGKSGSFKGGSGSRGSGSSGTSSRSGRYGGC